MTAQELFEDIRQAEGRIKDLEEKIEMRRDAVLSITPHMDPDGGGHGSADPDRMGRYAAEVDDLLTEIGKVRQRRDAEMTAAMKLLDRLESAQRRVIYQMYIKGLPVRVIAKRMRFCDGYVRDLRSKAMKKLDGVGETEIHDMLPEWYWHD